MDEKLGKDERCVCSPGCRLDISCDECPQFDRGSFKLIKNDNYRPEPKPEISPSEFCNWNDTALYC